MIQRRKPYNPKLSPDQMCERFWTPPGSAAGVSREVKKLNNRKMVTLSLFGVAAQSGATTICRSVG